MPHTTATSSPSRFGRLRLAAVMSLVALVASLTVGLPGGTGSAGAVEADHPRTISIHDASVDEGDDGTASLVLTVGIDSVEGDPLPPEQDITFTWSTSPDSTGPDPATVDEDYTPVSGGTGTIAAPTDADPDGEVETTVSVEVHGDVTIEPDETFLVTLDEVTSETQDGVKNASINDGTATATIDNDDPKISIADAEVSEGDTAALTVSLTTAFPEDGDDVTVDWTTGDDTGDDTATAGDDYTAETSGTATIPAGQQGTTVSVDTTQDEEIENDETFTVTLSNPAPTGNVFAGDMTATVTILDDEPRVHIDDASVEEGHEGSGNDVVFTVRVEPAADSAVTVGYATVDGTATAGEDYMGVDDAQLTIDPGTEGQIPISLIGDLEIEGDEDFTLELTDVSGPASLPPGTSAVGTIKGDDGAPTVWVEPSEFEEGVPGGTAAMPLRVKLSSASGGDITLEYATEDGTAEDGRPSWGPERLWHDQDRDFESVPVAEDAEGAQEPNDGRFTIPAGATEATVPVTVFGDDKHEADETFTVELSEPDDVSNPPLVFADGSSPEGHDSRATGTIVNDDPIPTVTVADTASPEGDGDESYFAEFALRLSNPSDQAVTVNHSTSNGSATAPDDYQQTDGETTFEASEGQFDENVMTEVGVRLVSDDTAEANETLHLSLTNPSNAQLPEGAAKITATGTILNDDGPHVLIDDVDVVEGDDGTTDATFTVTLKEGDGDVAADWTTADGTATAGEDYTAADGTLTVPDDADGATVTVDVTGDTAPEPDRTFFVDLLEADGATIFDGSGKATIVDDDAGRPIVKVAADGPGTEGSPVAFDASDSTDEDGQIVGYRWDFGDGSDPVDTSGPTTEHAFGDDGTYEVAVTATDDAGDTGTGRLTVEVANAAPTATAGDDVSVEVHDPATLAGDATDPGDDELTFTWNPGDGTDPVTGRSATHTYTETGDYTATLTVTDGDGGTDTDTLTVQVQPDGGEVARVSGGSRIETAVEASRAGWPAPDDGTAAATDVVLATAWNYPDALAGGTVAALLDAPVLLTDTDALPDAVRAEIDRLGAQRVWILGGPAAVSDAVAADLQADGRQVFRFAGTDRFATAAKIARSTGTTGDGEVALALGSHPDPARAWPDALSAGALAAVPDPLPVLLTGPDSLPGATEQALADLDVKTVYVVGGTAAIAPAVADRLAEFGYTVERLAGAHRYATSVATAAEAAARHGSDGAASVVFATGANFPDGLAAAPLAARRNGTVVLTPPDSVPDGTRTFLADRAHRLDTGTVLGGAAAVAETVREALRSAIVAE